MTRWAASSDQCYHDVDPAPGASDAALALTQAARIKQAAEKLYLAFWWAIQHSRQPRIAAAVTRFFPHGFWFSRRLGHGGLCVICHGCDHAPSAEEAQTPEWKAYFQRQLQLEDSWRRSLKGLVRGEMDDCMEHFCQCSWIIATLRRQQLLIYDHFGGAASILQAYCGHYERGQAQAWHISTGVHHAPRRCSMRFSKRTTHAGMNLVSLFTRWRKYGFRNMWKRAANRRAADDNDGAASTGWNKDFLRESNVESSDTGSANSTEESLHLSTTDDENYDDTIHLRLEYDADQSSPRIRQVS